jgi:hypothetical protein
MRLATDLHTVKRLSLFQALSVPVLALSVAFAAPQDERVLSGQVIS